MTFSDNISGISKIDGVDQYILIDDKGKVAAQSVKKPQKVFEIIFSCGQYIRAIGKDKFQYAVFSRENKKNIIIFPIGNYSLGVVKQKNIETLVLVDIVLKFLHELLRTKILYKREDP